MKFFLRVSRNSRGERQEKELIKLEAQSTQCDGGIYLKFRLALRSPQLKFPSAQLLQM